MWGLDLYTFCGLFRPLPEGGGFLNLPMFRVLLLVPVLVLPVKISGETFSSMTPL